MREPFDWLCVRKTHDGLDDFPRWCVPCLIANKYLNGRLHKCTRKFQKSFHAKCQIAPWLRWIQHYLRFVKSSLRIETVHIWPRPVSDCGVKPTFVRQRCNGSSRCVVTTWFKGGHQIMDWLELIVWATTMNNVLALIINQPTIS